MKTIDLIASIQNGTFQPAALVAKEVKPYEIFNISDLEVLRKIAHHQNDFAFLSKTETWRNDRNRQFTLGLMDNLNAFLREIANNGCRCIKYKYLSCDPEVEEKNGLISISQKKEDGYFFSFECTCTVCKSSYSVSQHEERFGHQNVWLRKSANQMFAG